MSGGGLDLALDSAATLTEATNVLTRAAGIVPSVALVPGSLAVPLMGGRPWSSWTPEPGSGRWCYLLSHSEAVQGRVPMITADVAESVTHLSRWRTLAAAPWSGTPGAAGCTMLRAQYARCATSVREPTWLDRIGDPSDEWHVTGEADDHPRSWHTDRAGRFRHEYDANAAYLSSAQGVTLARWSLSRLNRGRQRSGYDPGLYRVRLAPWHGLPLPHPAGPSGARAAAEGTPVVLAHPTLDLLHELTERGLYGGFTIESARTSQRPSRVLRVWATVLREIMYGPTADDYPPIAATAKAVYRETIGMFGRPGGRIYRPDWRAAIVAYSRATLWRKAERIGMTTDQWPVSINVDAITYASDEPDPVKAAPVPLASRKLGSFKVKSTMCGGDSWTSEK